MSFASPFTLIKYLRVGLEPTRVEHLKMIPSREGPGKRLVRRDKRTSLLSSKETNGIDHFSLFCAL
jgi:hypothetical protein